MRKRKERIDKWRKEKNKNLAGKQDSNDTKSATTSNTAISDKSNKKWNLEDDDEDEEHHQQQLQQQEAKNNDSFQFLNKKQEVKEEEQEQNMETNNDLKRKANNDEEDEDPLDAYMKEIYKKTPKIIKSNPFANEPSSSVGSKKVTIVMGVAKSTDALKQKGQIMEQDIDGLEYELSDDELQTEESAAAAGITTAASSSDSNLLLDPSLMVNKVKTKSEMVSTDHSKIYYRPFKKNFYVEVPEIAIMTNEEVELFREELEGKSS